MLLRPLLISLVFAAYVHADTFVAKPDAYLPANPAIGATVTWNLGQPNETTGLVFGTDAFTEVQGAIDAAAIGDTVFIDEGDYIKGDTILIEKNLTLTGENRETTRLLREETADPHSVITSRADVTIENVTVSGGLSEVRRSGGGIDAQETLTVRNSIIENNSALGVESGGGIGGEGPTIIVDSCLVRGNDCNLRDSGGGIGGREPNITVHNSIISENRSTENNSGAGIGGFAPTITVTNSLIRNNTSTDIDSSGGIGGRRPTITVINTTITENEATKARSGGGIGGLGPTITVIHCTITGNIASGPPSISNGRIDQSSGGIGDRTFNNNIIVTNSIVAGNVNTDSRNTEEDILGNLTDNGGNIIGIPNGLTIDDILLPLAKNGGPTETYALAPNSPAINIGLNNAIGDITTDQRGDGFPRILNNIADSGAFEADTSITLDPFDDSDADGLPLILELAIGTEPNAPDFVSEKLLGQTFQDNGQLTHLLGRGLHPLPDTILVLERSPSLAEGSFEEVFRINLSAGTSFTAAGFSLSTEEQPGFIDLIETSPSEHAFYRLGAILSE